MRSFLNILITFLKSYQTVYYNLVIILISFVQTILITKNFSQKEYGTYGYFISLSQIILIITQWGFNTWGVNKLTQEVLNKRIIILKNILLSRLLLGFISIVLTVIYLLFVEKILSFKLITSFILYFISIALSLELNYISEHQVTKMVKINMLSRLASIIILGIIIYNYKISSSDLFLLFSIQNILATILLYRHDKYLDLKILKLKVDPIQLKTFIGKSTYNFLIVFSSFLFASGPIILAGYYLNKVSFSVIYACSAIIKMIQSAYIPMTQKIIPKLNANIDIKSDLKLAIYYALLSNLLIFIFAPYIVQILFNEHYIGLVEGIRLYSFSLFPGIVSTILISQFAVYFKQEKYIFFLVFLLAFCTLATITLVNTNLSWKFVIKSMLAIEYVLFLALVVGLRKNIRSLRLVH